MPQSDLFDRFPQMKPMKGTPALMRVNGCGVGLYGSRDADPQSGTYVATWCLSIIFVPVLCLKAFRVAKADRGWYFIGREPLSAFAKAWNVVVLAGVLATVGAVQWGIYTSSPAYKAQRQMDAAAKMVEGGHFAQAANVYHSLAVTGSTQAGPATEAIGRVIDDKCPKAPLGECAGVYDSAARIARQGGGVIKPDELAAKGMKLIAARGDGDPRNALAVLDSIRPLVIDTRAVDASRLALLRKWAGAEPQNLEAITPLASLLEQQGQRDEARKLLMPVKDKLGDGEGARVLGVILSRDGDYDGAYALLWPYVESRLARLHAAEAAETSALDSLWQREVQVLKQKKGPSDFYDRYDAASTDDAKHVIVREYVNARIKEDPEFIGARDALDREVGVVPVALDLGMIMLERAQAQRDPAARTTQLQATEKVFLAVGGVAGESDAYRVSLGQVYYWLGKQAEGHKLFDDYLKSKSRGVRDLLAIAGKLRQVGAVAECRAMAEEAYGKGATPEEQHAAAILRSVASTDVDDKIEWLKKSDTADPYVRASLGKALGHKAYEEGRDAAAVKHFRETIEAYAALPRSATTANETALAYAGIFMTTGERDDMQRCADFFQQAVEMEPTDSVLQFNAGATLLQAALSDVIGGDIDLRLLREAGSVGMLRHLYHDEATRAAVAKRVMAHPGVARALSYVDKVMLLAPKNGQTYDTAYRLHRLTRNDAALRTLDERLRAAEVDAADQVANTKSLMAGTRDEQHRATLAALIKRAQDALPAARAKGGVTAAVALDQLAESMLTQDVFTHKVDPEAVVALAREADRFGHSSATRSAMIAALLFRAQKSLRQSDPAFDKFCNTHERSLGGTYTMVFAAAEPGPFRDKVDANKDVQEVVALTRDLCEHFNGSHSPYDWAILTASQDPRDVAAAKQVETFLRTDPRAALARSIESHLRPSSCDEALNTYWFLKAQGKPDAEARSAFSKVASLQLPVPVQP